MMLHELEEKVGKIVDTYRNWCVYEMTNLREELTEEELKLLMIVCVTKYIFGECNETADANYKFYIDELRSLKENAEAVKSTQAEIAELDIVPEPYTILEIRNIKLGKVLNKEK
jgi:hypothetical protein